VTVLAGVDRAALAVAFGNRLRAAGLSVGLAEIGVFTRALALSPSPDTPTDRASLYWVARTTLVHRWADIATFDAVFEAVFGSAGLAVDPNARRDDHLGDQSDDPIETEPPPDNGYSGIAPDERASGDLPWATLSGEVGLEVTNDRRHGVPERLPSAIEGFADTPFDRLDPTQLALLDEWLVTALHRWPARRSRRTRPHHSGRRLDFRRTMARARGTGLDPVELVRTRPVSRPRRIVMICDVSQSMQQYASSCMHLMRAAAVVADAEVFAFATSLTRLTRVLRHSSPEEAITGATEKVTDRFGGTRIGTNIAALLASPHADACRGAIVLIASDGWDSDPPEVLAAVMARLRRRAYRIVWLNPRASAAGYEPLVGGMAAALPHCDDMLAIGTAGSIREILETIVKRA
jgi:uncharacterized protein with von Willebrand factor type A (vWA) domain